MDGVIATSPSYSFVTYKCKLLLLQVGSNPSWVRISISNPVEESVWMYLKDIFKDKNYITS